jgi:hypothetical protein
MITRLSREDCRILAATAKKQQSEIKEYVRRHRYHGVLRESGRKLTGRRCDFESSFDVLVGSPPNQKCFNLHKDIMIERSGYFAAARSGRWNENELLKATDLTAEDPEVFKNYIYCAYFDRVCVKGFEITDASTFKENAAIDKKLDEEQVNGLRWPYSTKERFKGLMKVYLLANMLLDHKTANLVVDETLRTLDLLNTLPGAGAIHLIFENTVPGDGMRNFWIDWYAHNVPTIGFPEDEDDPRPWPNDFLAGVVKELQKAKRMQLSISKRHLFYKIHELFNGGWNPTEGQHPYYSGPGFEGEELLASDDEDSDWSVDEAVMTEDETTDTEMT